MKKITYRIFIYICLTTIIANTSASEPHKKCESSINEVVKQYLQTYAKGNKKCDPVDETTSKFDGTIDPHLCATIRDTVIEICKLNATLDLTLQEFKPQMAKLRTEVENVSKIVAELNESISNPVYKERINAIPNFQSIAMLNDHLGPKGQFICGSIDDPYNPLCLILLWTNRALVDTIIPPSKNATVDTVVTKKPSLPKNSTTKAVAHASEEHKPKENPPSAVGGAKDPSKEQKVVVQQTNIHDEASRVGNVTQSQVPKTEDPKQTAKLQETKSSQQQKPVGKADSISSQTNEKLGEIAQPGNTADKVPKQDVKKEKSKEEVKPTTQKPVTISEDTDNDQTEFEPPRDRVPEDVKEKEEIPVESNDPSHDESIVPQDRDSVYPIPSDSEPPQHFFAYFMVVSLMCLICYVGYHKKHKIMGIIFEGRKSRGGRGRKRPNTAGYRKLDCTLEEAVTSQCNSNVTHVIY